MALFTFRPEYEAPWVGLSHVTSIAIDRLAPAEVETLAEHVAGRPLPPELAAQIVAKTDGVPLFVEELTKTVLESGLLIAGPQAQGLSRTSVGHNGARNGSLSSSHLVITRSALGEKSRAAVVPQERIRRRSLRFKARSRSVGELLAAAPSRN